MAFAPSAAQRLYLVKQTGFGVVPAFAAANGCAAVNWEANNDQPVESRPDRDGTYSPTKGNLGALSMAWSADMSLAANGAAGTPPDCAPLLEAAFGSQVVSAGTHVIWAPHDSNEPYFAALDLAANPSMEQRIAFDCVPAQLILELSESFPRLRASGAGRCVISQTLFGSLPANMKGGLGAWPTLPSTIVTNGAPPQNRQGVITIDGNDMGATFETATITFDTGKGMDGPGWGAGGTAVTRGLTKRKRAVSVSISFTEDDSAGMLNMILKGFTGAYVPMTLQLGTVAGSRWLASFAALQFASPRRGSSNLNLGRTFTAFGYPSAGLDEFTLKAY